MDVRWRNWVPETYEKRDTLVRRSRTAQLNSEVLVAEK